AAPPTLDPQSADEEAARAVAVRQGEEELRQAWMGVLRPFAAQRLDLETAGFDHRLVLVGVHRANGIDDRPAGPDPARSGAEQLELELGQRRRAPAKVGPLREDAEARAGGVDESPVEALELRRQ